MTEDESNEFWRYSLTVYAAESVQHACLELQDQLGLDVNLALYCCWRARGGHTLSTAEMSIAITAVESWADEVVRPLRGVRRALPKGSGPDVTSLREAVKELELRAERIEQDRLFQLPPDIRLADAREANLGECAGRNLATYLRCQGITLTDEAAGRARDFLVAVFPDAPRADIVAGLAAD